jgi:hypothetical protein
MESFSLAQPPLLHACVGGSQISCSRARLWFRNHPFYELHREQFFGFFFF